MKIKSNGYKHGKTGSREYYCWWNMLNRCRRASHKSYADYGGRGIKVCQRWNLFANFYADMGDVPTAQHTIERKDSNGNYEPSNCVWATRMEQGPTRRNNHYLTLNGETHHMSEWSRITGIKNTTISMRITKYGWTVERALTEGRQL